MPLHILSRRVTSDVLDSTEVRSHCTNEGSRGLTVTGSLLVLQDGKSRMGQDSGKAVAGPVARQGVGDWARDSSALWLH